MQSLLRAEKIRNDGKKREIVVLEVNGTMTSLSGKGRRWLEAKLGIMYSGKSPRYNIFLQKSLGWVEK